MSTRENSLVLQIILYDVTIGTVQPDRERTFVCACTNRMHCIRSLREFIQEQRQLDSREDTERALLRYECGTLQAGIWNAKIISQVCKRQ